MKCTYCHVSAPNHCYSSSHIILLYKQASIRQRECHRSSNRAVRVTSGTNVLCAALLPSILSCVLCVSPSHPPLLPTYKVRTASG